MENIETPLVLSSLSRLVKPMIIYGGAIPYALMTITSACGVETAWATAAAVAGTLTIRYVVRRVNSSDGGQRLTGAAPADGE
jgi:hypothetical protein